MSTLPKHSSTSEGAKPVMQSLSEYEDSKVPLDEEKVVFNYNGSPDNFSPENSKVKHTEVMMESTNFGGSCYPEKGMNM